MRRAERGATLVEASLILPILLTVLLGTIEIGIAFKDHLNVSYTTREAARVGALAGDRADADCEIVKSVVDSLSSTGNLDDLQQLQIFQADPKSGARIPTRTNTWKLTGSDPYDCVNDWAVDELWPSTSRKTTFGPSSQLDIIGVRISMTHQWLSGFPPFRGSFTIDEQTISRIEPEAFE